VATLSAGSISMSCFLAALTIRLRARSFEAASSKSVWSKRAMALRMCCSSLIGR